MNFRDQKDMIIRLINKRYKNIRPVQLSDYRLPRVHQVCDVTSEFYKKDDFDIKTKKLIR